MYRDIYQHKDLRTNLIICAARPLWPISHWPSIIKYSRGNITWVKCLGANISYNKACKPINLGAKWKPLISSFQNCPWIWDLNLNCLSYDLEKEQNLNFENARNESVFVKLFFYFLALLYKSNSKIVVKNHLTIFPWFLAFKNCPWSSEYDKIHGSDSKFKFLIQNEDLQFSEIVTFWV